MRRKKAINLLELMIVTVIIGVLAGIAIPQYLNVVERQRASEAVQLLGLLRQAQIRYQVANGAFAGGAGTPCDTVGLDIDWSAPQYFEDVDCFTSGATIVAITRQVNTAYGQYVFTIDEDGAIACTNGAVAGSCAKIGY